MKKILFAIVLGLLLSPVAQAATLTSTYSDSFLQNEMRTINQITITATADHEITQQYGLDLLLGACGQMLWGPSTVSASGDAVNNGNMVTNVVPEYRKGYSTLHLPVLADFANGEGVSLSGLVVRAYRLPYSGTCLAVDVNGDGIADAQTNYSFYVSGTPGMDNVPPYPPTDFKAVVSADLKSVQLSWTMPSDFDVAGASVQRRLVRDGLTQERMVIDNIKVSSVVDNNVQAGDEVTYTLFVSDGYGVSDSVIASAKIEAPTPPVVVPPVVIPPVVTPPVVTPPTVPAPQSDEITQLTKLFGYYKTRQSIKCRTGISPTDSNCLWARIDVIYAQTLLGRSDVNIELSARDLELITLRIKYPEQRYQVGCVEATTKAKSCPALEKSIKRAHYFID